MTIRGSHLPTAFISNSSEVTDVITFWVQVSSGSIFVCEVAKKQYYHLRQQLVETRKGLNDLRAMTEDANQKASTLQDAVPLMETMASYDRKLIVDLRGLMEEQSTA